MLRLHSGAAAGVTLKEAGAAKHPSVGSQAMWTSSGVWDGLCKCLIAGFVVMMLLDVKLGG
jgi:hypothetical protein